ncbi:MAG: hypothetical protein KGL67_02225 [Patescibacteria group bacterium]|nr:hypothetical protein [Patescibacteria group bacterium]
MKIFFKEKPAKEEVLNYENKLNYFLQYLKAKVKIKLRDEPLRIESYTNGEHDDTTYFWVDSVIVIIPETNIETHLFSQYLGRDGKIFDEKYAWNDAFEIQENIYKKLNKIPTLLPNFQDVYWKLWELNKE